MCKMNIIQNFSLLSFNYIILNDFWHSIVLIFKFAYLIQAQYVHMSYIVDHEFTVTHCNGTQVDLTLRIQMQILQHSKNDPDEAARHYRNHRRSNRGGWVGYSPPTFLEEGAKPLHFCIVALIK